MTWSQILLWGVHSLLTFLVSSFNVLSLLVFCSHLALALYFSNYSFHGAFPLCAYLSADLEEMPHVTTLFCFQWWSILLKSASLIISIVSPPSSHSSSSSLPGTQSLKSEPSWLFQSLNAASSNGTNTNFLRDSAFLQRPRRSLQAQRRQRVCNIKNQCPMLPMACGFPAEAEGWAPFFLFYSAWK